MRRSYIFLILMYSSINIGATNAEVLTLKVKEANINKDYSASLLISGDVSCERVALNPGQMTTKDVQNRVIPMNVIGLNCLKAPGTKDWELKVSDVRTYFFDFLKRKRGSWTLEFREGNQFKGGDVRQPIILSSLQQKSPQK